MAHSFILCALIKQTQVAKMKIENYYAIRYKYALLGAVL